MTAERNLPTEWGPGQNVVWKVPVPGAGASTPAVWGERIFLTACDGRLNDRLHVLCYHRDDGRLLWRRQFFGSAEPESQYAPGGMAVPSPATDGRRVFALFGTGDLICLDLDGRPVWIRSLAQEYGRFRNRWGMAASPALADGLLVVQVDHWGESYLLGIDAATGANRWRTRRDAAVNWTSPVIARVQGTTLVIAAGTYQVQGYDAESGKERWAVKGLGPQCIPSPVVDGDRLYALSGRDNFTLAIRLDGGHGDLTDSHVLWRAKNLAAFVPSPVCYAGHYYYIEDATWGYCLDAATGARRWRERLGGKYHASLLAGDGKVYFPSMEGTVTVVKAGPTFDVIARNDLEETLLASPAVSDGSLFLRGDKHLYRIGRGGKDTPAQP